MADMRVIFIIFTLKYVALELLAKNGSQKDTTCLFHGYAKTKTSQLVPFENLHIHNDKSYI